MSADGYFRLPRKLMRAKISHEWRDALVWLVSEASYAERESDGVQLRVRETPPVSLSRLEKEFRWSRKTARAFLCFVLSSECAKATGIRIRVGQKILGHSSGHSSGHSRGHTYLVGLVKDTIDEGHNSGHSSGHSSGQPVVKKTVEKTDKKKTPMGHGMARMRHEYDPLFLKAWQASPYRVGNNPKLAAAKAWRSTVKAGADPEVLIAAMERYAAFCDATNLTGTRHAMQVATFYGPGQPWDQAWDTPEFHSNGNGKPRWR